MPTVPAAEVHLFQLPVACFTKCMAALAAQVLYRCLITGLISLYAGLIQADNGAAAVPAEAHEVAQDVLQVGLSFSLHM